MHEYDRRRRRLVVRYASGAVVAALLACALPSSPLRAATVTGKVTVAGAALDGALVTVSDDRGRMETVYTNEDGSYTLDTALSGALELRVRKRYHHDDVRRIELGAQDRASIDVALTALTDAREISDDHPALSHFSRIAFDTDPAAPYSRANFTRDCLSCHQLGNSFTRWPRPAAGWVPTVQRMHGYLANADMAAIEHRAAMLAQAFDGSLVSSRPEIPVDPRIHGAKIRQWKLPGTVVPHDAEYSRRYDKVFISDMFAGDVVEVDLKTDTIERFKLPDDGVGPGGEFTRRGLPAPYGLTVARAPHSLAENSDGNFYLTDSIGAAITVFDPRTRAFRNHAVGSGALYPHTVRVDRHGIVWFTIAFSNQVGRFDPAGDTMQVVDLPETPSLSAPGTTIPYGIDVHPVDGGIWYSKLASDKIGRIDPTTLAVREFDSPVRGPRRLRFDRNGALWVTGFADGSIAKIDTAKWQAEVYELPVYAPGEVPAPYALAVHPATQEIWINDTMLDLAWRFLPYEKRFIAYPLPTKGTYTRDFSFTTEGWACTSNNPIPAAALEGGVPELICIDPGPAPALAVTQRGDARR